MAVTTNFGELFQFIREFPDLVLDESVDPMRETMQAVRENLPPYPPEKPRDLIAWDSDRQRRWYHWAVANGLLENPYQRTMGLENAIEPTAERADDFVDGHITVNQETGMFILGSRANPKEKAAIHAHAGRWWEFDQEIDLRWDLAITTFWDKLWGAITPIWGHAA